MSPTQRNAMVAVIVLLHAAGAWGLWQVQEVRDAVREAAPMFVSLIAPERPPEPVPPPPPPVVPKPIAPRLKPLPAPVMAAAPSPAATSFTVPEAPPAPPEPPMPPPPVVAAAPAPPAPPPAPAPKVIPASAVQYLEPPQLVYPRLSRRNAESGRVGVRVYIDTAGLPALVQVSQSSGHARLDDAAVDAVRKARFKPYTENGQPTAGWASIALEFELEK